MASHGPAGATFNAWNPGIRSQVPKELLPLTTIFRAANVVTSVASALELSGLTGLPLDDLVVFRAERLVLHELLIRVTADLEVPDGSRIGDLGINFRGIVARLLERHVLPHIAVFRDTYATARQGLTGAVEAAFSGTVGRGARDWGPTQIDALDRQAGTAVSEFEQNACRSLSKVMSALFQTHGSAWGTRELMVSLATDLGTNACCSDAIGRVLAPLFTSATREEGYRHLPPRTQPVIINTKGASASGKSTLRLLQKELAASIGVEWRDFALISPDIWRKQLLDYASLGDHYKYAGAFTAAELRIVDQKLDRYMAHKHERGNMSHLLIDRFRFDSFAPDSAEAGSNLLTRFGQAVYLFLVITPPESLVERAWKRGLEFGRYKAVDDTLAHSVEAYTGIPDMFLTWARRNDKLLRFEFLDNTVALGQRPRTVAFGDNFTMNVLDCSGLMNIERYGRINVNARAANELYADSALLAPDHNMAFLKRCVKEFRHINFADQSSGKIYLQVERGAVVHVAPDALAVAVEDEDTLVALSAIAPKAWEGSMLDAPQPPNLQSGRRPPTLGEWGASNG